MNRNLTIKQQLRALELEDQAFKNLMSALDSKKQGSQKVVEIRECLTKLDVLSHNRMAVLRA